MITYCGKNVNKIVVTGLHIDYEWSVLDHKISPVRKQKYDRSGPHDILLVIGKDKVDAGKIECHAHKAGKKIPYCCKEEHRGKGIHGKRRQHIAMG
jgi:hypothetical protein